MSRPKPVRGKVLAALHTSGPIHDRSGRATGLLAELMGYPSRPVSLSPLLSMLETDGFVTREVRGRRCFAIELTPKGEAMVELDVGLHSRRLRPSDDDVVADSASWAGVSPIGAAPDVTDAERPTIPERRTTAAGLEDLLRREMHDLLFEVGALRHRVAELERQVAASTTGEGVARGQDAWRGGRRETRSGRTG